MSPDGRYVAVTVMNGWNLGRESPFANDFGLLKAFSLDRYEAVARGRGPGRSLVPGGRLEQASRDAAGAVRGRRGDPGLSLRRRGPDQDGSPACEWGAYRDPHGHALTACRAGGRSASMRSRI